MKERKGWYFGASIETRDANSRIIGSEKTSVVCDPPIHGHDTFEICEVDEHGAIIPDAWRHRFFTRTIIENCGNEGVIVGGTHLLPKPKVHSEQQRITLEFNFHEVDIVANDTDTITFNGKVVKRVSYKNFCKLNSIRYPKQL